MSANAARAGAPPCEASDNGFAIGGIALRNAVSLAPMSGVTDLAMRGLAMRCGAGHVVTEMVASDRLAAGDQDALLRAGRSASGAGPHVVQLAGRDPRWMAQAARAAEAGGADIIDINMGCPARKVTGGWSGSALMRDLALAVSLIEATVVAVRVPVTVKMRLGWDDTTLNAPDLARGAEAAGAAALTVHGRTRCQFYNGRADWAAIRAVVEAVHVPVIANGDCTSVQDARRMLKASGAHGVMVGRAAQGRCWLPGWIAKALATGVEAPPPSPEVQRDLLLDHHDGLLSLYGRSGLRHARKHLASGMAAIEETAGAGDPALKALVLTGEDPSGVAQDLRRFVDSAGERLAA